MKQHTVEKSIPRRFPVVLEDRILYWMQNSHCSTWNLIIAFDGQIDFARMKKAVRLILDCEPVLGCRFVKGFLRQYWERVADLDSKSICKIVESADYDNDLSEFIATLPNIDTHEGPQLQAYVLRSKNDTLCIRVNHVPADGGGGHDIAKILDRIYTRLGKDPDYYPTPNLGGSRSLRQVSMHFGLIDYIKILRRSFLDMWGFVEGVTFRLSPIIIRKPERSTLFMRKISPKRFIAIKKYGKKRGASVNDVLTSIMLRSFYSVITPDPKASLRVVTTADLRRYIPGGKGQAVCNLSGFSYINVGRGIPKTFDQLLKIVIRQFADLKKNFIGTGSLPVSALIFKLLPFSVGLWIHDKLGNFQKRQTATTGDVALLLSNGGRFDAKNFKFSGTPLARIWLTLTRPTPPVLGLCVCGFNQKLTISAGFCENTISRKRVNQLLDRVEAEVSQLGHDPTKQPFALATPATDKAAMLINQDTQINGVG